MARSRQTYTSGLEQRSRRRRLQQSDHGPRPDQGAERMAMKTEEEIKAAYDTFIEALEIIPSGEILREERFIIGGAVDVLCWRLKDDQPAQTFEFDINRLQQRVVELKATLDPTRIVREVGEDTSLGYKPLPPIDAALALAAVLWRADCA